MPPPEPLEARSGSRDAAPGNTSEAGVSVRRARLRAALSPHYPALAAAAVGLAWFLVHVGPGVLDPTNVAWLMRGDWGANYLGWAFFRHAPVSLPLGANPLYPYPAGSTLGFTDSIPIVGILLRPFAPLLADDFQYVGPWLGLCFALQGFAGAKLVRLVAPGAIAQFLGGALFALAPPLLHRVVGPNTGHASLSAHWLVLAFLWLALAPVTRSPWRRLGAAAVLLFVAAGTHPYHAVMGAALAGAMVLRLWLVDRLLDWKRGAASLAAVPAVGALSLAAFGFFTPGVATAAGGYGFYSADALALVSPMGWSRLWNGPKLGHGQYEGFGYLGAGALVALATAAGSALARRARVVSSRWRAAIPALVAALALALLSLSNRITLGGDLILELDGGGALKALAATFRSSGRFVWTLHYLALFGALAGIAVAWRDRPRLVAAAFAGCLSLQLADVRPPVPIDPGSARWQPPASEIWGAAAGAYRHVVLYPPYLLAGGAPVAPELCGGIGWPMDGHLPAASVAYRLGASLNSGYTARIDPAAAGRGCATLRLSTSEGRLDPETIYVVLPSLRSVFAAAGAACGTVDGLLTCVAGGRRDPFSEALRRFGGP